MADLYPETDSERLECQNSLALEYKSNMQFDNAIQLMQHVVSVREKSLPVDHPDRLRSESALSEMQNDQ